MKRHSHLANQCKSLELNLKYTLNYGANVIVTIETCEDVVITRMHTLVVRAFLGRAAYLTTQSSFTGSLTSFIAYMNQK